MQELLKKLSEKSLTLGSVESMSGGLFAARFTDVPGASKVFKGAVVSYSPLIKENVVHVKKGTIDKYSVVSSQVAEEMARNGQKLLNVDVLISITGNAGPTCEPGEEKVGSVYLGLMIKDKYFGKHLALSGSRDEIRIKSVDEMKSFILEKI